jgi:hypothetical protein
MPRLWLAALGAAAVIACGDDDSGGGPNDLFPDVAGVYAIEGEFDAVPPEDASFTGSVTIEQESLESSILTGSANITLTEVAGDVVITNAELQDASVSLAGIVEFTVENPAAGVTSWTFTGERAGDLLEGQHTLTRGSQSQSGSWSGLRP